jgi:hypothetical protein
MLANIERVAKPGCLLALWYSMLINGDVVSKRFGAHIATEDKAFMALNPRSTIRARLFRL